MALIDRRTFVAAGGTLAAGPRIAAPRARGSIEDVAHVVILMQENRSFDHYFGTLRGVRGFGEPRPAILPSGRTVWEQQQDAKDGGAIVRPFRLDTRATAAGCIGSLDHSWKGSHARWKHWDVWMPEKGPLAMGHMTRDDLAYYYALADQFTICDAYHASLHGPTGPNRLYHWTGTSGPSVGREGPWSVDNDGVDPNPGADMAKDDPRFAGLGWTPYPARLTRAGVTWRVYQEYDNYSDNPLGYFAEFRDLDPAGADYARARAWAAGSTPANADASRGEHLIRAFAADVAADRLPQVSWIVAPFHMCEHPDAPPAYGQMLTARLIAALAANPAVWAKTAFILNYDENDGFFDHVSPPLPATLPGMGASTVPLRGESYRGEPIGLGVRVPLLVASPWTRGGWVSSELADHTSVLRFLERRFGVMEPNISPWRRAVCGDLTTMFDFDLSPAARRDTAWLSALPAVDDYLANSDAACRRAKPVAPQSPAAAAAPPLPRQEAGTRPARALPYRLDVVARWAGDRQQLVFRNDGTLGAVFIVDSADGAGPRHYTVGAGQSLSDDWPVAAALTVRGPNGFYRAIGGGDTRIACHATRAGAATRIGIVNHGTMPVTIAIRSRYGAVAGGAPTLAPGAATAVLLAPVAAHRWYDVTVEATTGDGGRTIHRLAGHWETGAPGISEPALGEVA
ncbi:MAG: phospholipase C, phosphocholine-specific [Sphingomonas hengshuiensis]|uniref:Phospholipase C, phosphocholine-specific n=2 Tax=Sphingomonas TaxID=13687 RepID=A0A2W4Z8E4_9SPHN|nr:MAG: phospholipase C, phosphocholine-specific [Sphingomonas hengshuiensis]